MTQIRGDIEEAKLEKKNTSERYPETEMLEKRLEWFQDLKLGVIMHWGLYAEAGIVESWQLSEQDEWAREPKAWREDIKELQRDYWNLIDDFSPTLFDAKVWAQKCQAAGFNYFIFTTKHHDGFNLYDTQETEYKITGNRSSFKEDPRSDLLKEAFTAFREAGLAVGAYYSKADWHSPYYWLPDETPKGRRASYDPQQNPELWEKYVGFVQRQLHELTHNYGAVDLLWLDAGWCGTGREDLRMDEIVADARQAQPELIVVDRMMGGRHENYVTPERKIPTISEIPEQVWESNIPLGNDWGYTPFDQFKSSQEIIGTLIDVVAKGGNLILGLGPKPDGTFTAEEDQILIDLGTWLDCYGEGIYSTRPLADLSVLEDWKITQTKDAYYFFFVGAAADQKTEIQVSNFNLPMAIQEGYTLNNGEKLQLVHGILKIPANFYVPLFPGIKLVKMKNQ
ncbi:alpha-L-fucosidase [Carnobacterium gallinarum]|uniref:alpha-L-fucosidase n=1 Tax=Carnobacterium gallinarum TaxID=2749 RepID=UPI000689DC31|nr:alpha-L-fucosidase [Carnobacterium gallinarum]